MAFEVWCITCIKVNGHDCKTFQVNEQLFKKTLKESSRITQAFVIKAACQ